VSERSIVVDGLTRRFGSFTAVDGISFVINAGEIWGFLGPNGAGKSTTIRMLCGVLTPTSGTARVLGYDVAADPEAVKLNIGYMPQGSSLWNDLSVEEHLRFYAGLFSISGARRERRIDEWMQRLDLRTRRTQLAGTLSGGYRKRLALACTLLHEPKMIFLDEPTSGVDPLSRREFWDIIVTLAEGGVTVLVTTHYLDEAEHCDQLALIYGGKIVARGTPEALKRAPENGVTVELLAADVIPILTAVEGLPYVRNAGLYGSALHVAVGNEQGAERLESDLAPYAVASCRRVTPSLEDVFAAVVKSP
jgi:ABC-2 type transport system ATP-binding protein